LDHAVASTPLNDDVEAAPPGPNVEGRKWMFVMCYPGGSGGWISVPTAANQPVVSARLLAERARDSFRLPLPKPGSSPPNGTLVNIPTYLFVDKATWAPDSATAQVPGTAVTVTATPVRVEWSMGEGGSGPVICPGPGGAYSASAQSPACGYRFRQSSSRLLGAARPGFRVTARAVYEIRWTCSGICDENGGVLDPLTPAGSLQLPVYEARSQLVS
jgi:hypothetical protein